jgi:hypothetical protein
MRSGACRDSFCTIRLTCGPVLSIVLGGILIGGGFGGATGSLAATDRRFASQLPNSGLVDKKQLQAVRKYWRAIARAKQKLGFAEEEM